MKKLHREFFGAIFTTLLLQLLVSSQMSCIQAAQESAAREVASSILGSESGGQVTVEQFIRLLPAAFGFAHTISYKMPRDTLVTCLMSVGVLPRDVKVDFDMPLTRGRVSVLLVKSLRLGKGSLLERSLISLFASQEASFRVALRERRIPAGDIGDVITRRELAAIILAAAASNMSKPLPQADTRCIALFVQTILSEVIDIVEAEKMLNTANLGSVRSMLAF